MSKGKPILKGLSCPGDKRVATCKVRVVLRENLDQIKNLQKGECLVTDEIKPEDHVDEYMEKAAGIIQNVGGKGCHTNMFAFAHNIPAIADTYGQSGEGGTEILKNGQEIVLESFTATEEVTKADGSTRRKNIGTVYENMPDQGVPGGLGSPTLADIMKKWGVKK
jgi:phosphoenolpyruvate synthase/pyruvate phosphate dikinase